MSHGIVKPENNRRATSEAIQGNNERKVDITTRVMGLGKSQAGDTKLRALSNQRGDPGRLGYMLILGGRGEVVFLFRTSYSVLDKRSYIPDVVYAAQPPSTYGACREFANSVYVCRGGGGGMRGGVGIIVMSASRTYLECSVFNKVY